MGSARRAGGAGGPGGDGSESRGVASLYLDESVSNSILAGVLIALLALWALWGASWLRRVELRRENDATVRSLGLAWAREGLGPSVRAVGRVGGRVVEVRWRRWITGAPPRATIDAQVASLDDVIALDAPEGGR